MVNEYITKTTTLMKTALNVLMIIVLVWSCGQAPAESDAPTQPKEDVQTFDANLAEEVGADEYGMRRYVFAYLKAGPNRDQDSTTAT